MDKWSCILQSRLGTYCPCHWKVRAYPEAKVEETGELGWREGNGARLLCVQPPGAAWPLSPGYPCPCAGDTDRKSMASKPEPWTLLLPDPTKTLCPTKAVHLPEKCWELRRPVILKNSFELWSLHSFGKWATARLEKAFAYICCYLLNLKLNLGKNKIAFQPSQKWI